MVQLVNFYYDIACPYSYVVTYALRRLLCRSDVVVNWKPVYFGSINSSSFIGSPIAGRPSPSKIKWVQQDLYMTMDRLQVPIRRQAKHLDHSQNTQRLLASLEDNKSRQKLSLALFRYYWQDDGDIENLQNLHDISRDVGLSFDVTQQIQAGTDRLKEFTTEASKRGVYRLPSFYVADKLYTGMDRVHFIEKATGDASAKELRLALPEAAAPGRKVKLTFYYDFTSPWSYIANEYMPTFIRNLHPIDVEVEYVPVLLGAIFHALGTSFIPVQKVQQSRISLSRADINEYLHHLGNITMKPNSNFPMQSILPLRVAIANDSADIRKRFFEAAWLNDRDISSTEEVSKIVKGAGLNLTTVLKQIQDQSVKTQLRNNVTRAIKAGVFGVPSFQVDSGPVIFGVDRMNVVADMICGWNYVPKDTSKL